MTVKELIERLERVQDPERTQVMIPIVPATPSGLRDTPCVGVIALRMGIDWDSHKLFLHPEKRLTDRDVPELISPRKRPI